MPEHSSNIGRAALYGHNATTLGVINGLSSVGQIATLQTNITPENLTAGLKSNMDFTVEGRFDLVMPQDIREQYGIGLNDTSMSQTGNNVVSLVVRRNNDNLVHVDLNQLNLVSASSTILGGVVLAPLAGGDDQIVLRLTHDDVSPGVIVASFDLLDNGVVTSTQTLSVSGQVFQGENWVQAQFLAAATPENTQTIAGTSPAHGRAGRPVDRQRAQRPRACAGTGRW